MVRNIFAHYHCSIHEIINDTELKVIDKIKQKLKVDGLLFKNGKLIDKQTKIRRALEAMNKCQAGIFDLAIELFEDLEYEIKHKIKSKPDRPRKENNETINISKKKTILKWIQILKTKR